MRKIYVSDLTLKRISHDRKNPLLFREKTAIASAVDNMGVDAVELPEIKKLREDTIIYKTIAKVVKNSAICIEAGSTTADIDKAWECVAEASKPCLQIVLPVSTVQMEYLFHMKAPKMAAKIQELCAYAKTKCENVEFIASDATRAEEDFLISAFETAVSSGATAVTVSDDAGIYFPQEYNVLIKKIKEKISVPVYVRVSDALDMATACAFAAINSGADGVKVAAVGRKELSTDKFSYAVKTRAESFGFCTGLEITKVHSDIKALVASVSTEGTEITASQGDDICLDVNSTDEQIIAAAQKLGYALSDEDAGFVVKGLKRVCEKKISVGAKELEALVAAYAKQAPSTYHLDNYTATSSNTSASIAHVVLTQDDRKISGTGSGDGPIDAAFSAIEQGIGCHYELDDFQILTVTSGKDSLGSAIAKLRSNGKLYAGNGVSTDIVSASIRAYINALNKIVYDVADED